jgi:quaternary ammonium compound-resistance protein SugE
MSWMNPSPAQAWILLALAGALEIVWAVGMKATHGFTRIGASIVVLIVALLSFWLLGLAMKTLPVGTAYAVWVGIGAVGAALFGMLLLGEPATVARMVCLLMIVGGVAGLRLFSDH